MKKFSSSLLIILAMFVIIAGGVAAYKYIEARNLEQQNPLIDADTPASIEDEPLVVVEKEIQIFNWIDFHDTDRISLPRKIKEDRIFDYDKAIEKAKEFENIKLT